MRKNEINVLEKQDSASPLPIVAITQKAFQKLSCYIDLCKYEISGLGSIDCVNNVYTINDVFILKQITDQNGCHVEMDPKALSTYVYEIVSNGGDVENIKFQWHSHVNMSAFFSSEDIATTGNYMNDFMISLVMNKKGEYSCRLDLFKPIQLSLKLPLFVKIPFSDYDLLQQCKDDIKKHVCIKKTFLGKKNQHLDDVNFGEILVEVDHLINDERSLNKDELSETTGNS